MGKYLQRLTWGVLMAVCYGSLLQAGCLNAIQQNLDLLWAPEANLDYVYSSALVNWFGPGILKFW